MAAIAWQAKLFTVVAFDEYSTKPQLAATIFGDKDFSAFKTDIGIVTTNWTTQTPTVFKTSKRQAHGRLASFQPGYGCTIAAAVVASCAAFPFFEVQTVKAPSGKTFTLGDGGFCANNPALYALADALGPLGFQPGDIRLVSVGVGSYPPREQPVYHWSRWLKYLPARWMFPVLPEMIQKVMDVNTQSMEVLQQLLYGNSHLKRKDEFPLFASTANSRSLTWQPTSLSTISTNSTSSTSAGANPLASANRSFRNCCSKRHGYTGISA